MLISVPWVVLVSLLCSYASAADFAFPLPNTGVDGGGVAQNNNDPELTWTLFSVPSGSSSLIVRTQAGGYPNNVWLGDSAASAWVGPNNVPFDTSPVGTYVFRLSFNLPAGVNNVHIGGQWATDNDGTEIEFNGVPTGHTSASYGAFTPFDIRSDPAHFNVPLVSPGVNTLDFFVDNSAPAVSPVGLRVEITISHYSTSSVLADPHFVGFNGAKYDFQGEADKTFALISDEMVQLNSHFIPFRKALTYMGPTCIRACDETLLVYPGGLVLFNGSTPATEEVYGRYIAIHMAEDKRSLIARVPGWTFNVTFSEKDGFRYIDLPVLAPGSMHSNVAHGVVGWTLRHAPEQEKCNNDMEGSCQLPGEWQDYEITKQGTTAEELCSVEWKNAQFSEAECAKHSTQRIARFTSNLFDRRSW